MMRRWLLFLLTWSSLASGQSMACLWDYDTLAMERQRFPEAQELIAGHFVRHSAAYYQWRLSDRLAKPIEQRTPGDYDDIAVAHDKHGEHEKAIETIRAKMERWPVEGRYESEANLGTFYIHAGRLEEGLQHINKALELNPDAHFGRERYQKLLVEYILSVRKDDDRLPLNDGHSLGGDGFAAFVLAQRQPQRDQVLAEVQSAVKGVLGMMRFGRHDSPLLLEALGDLLLVDGMPGDSKMLAARAYLRASYEVGDLEAAIYRAKAEKALELKFGRELSEIESDLKQEIDQGNSFFSRIAADEAAWWSAGANVDERFAEKYYEEPQLKLSRLDWKPTRQETRGLILVVGIAVTLLAVCVLLVTLVIRRRRRKARANVSSTTSTKRQRVGS